MQDNECPHHWRFALATAYARLEELIWRFDMEAEAGKHAFADVGPGYLTTIIDGFLSERDRLLPSSIKRLQRMRDYLQERLAPLYLAGQERAHQRWSNASPEERPQFFSLEPEDIRQEARSALPSEDLNLTEESWFIEGFARKWSDEWMEYAKSTLENNGADDE